MTSQMDARFSHCSHIGSAVWTEQTEGQCRDQHHCAIYTCPLQDKFANDRSKVNLQAIAAGWVGLFPARRQRHR